MIKHFNSFRLIWAGLIALIVSSCQYKEERHDIEPPRYRASLSVAIDDHEEIVETKSVLDNDIETKLTSVSVVIYNSDNSLFEANDYTSGFDNLQYTFEPDETYRIFAVANMGAMASSFPTTYSASALENITYSIPGYTTTTTGVNTRGIPMAGSLTFIAGTSEETIIPLTRLMAKVSVDIAAEGWPGRINSVKLCNLNKILRPFGSSAAVNESTDLLPDGEEIEVPETAASSGHFYFYVPENMQGTISAISTSTDKSQDNTDAIPAEKAAVCTYVETVMSGSSSYGIDGTITYRSYLGNNATSNFDIARNSRYNWSIRYFVDGMSRQDWKADSDLSWRRFSYSKSWTNYMYYQGKEALATNLNCDNYEHGVLTPLTPSQNKQLYNLLPSGVNYTWAFSNNCVTPYNSNQNPKVQYYYVYGNTPGTCYVTNTIDDGFGTTVLGGNITVLNFGRKVFLRVPGYGDFYDGQSFTVPENITIDNLQIGMEVTPISGASYKICPVIISEDNLFSFHAKRGDKSDRIIDYYDNGEGHGKPATFSYKFVKAYSLKWQYLELFCYYNDYGQYNGNSVTANVNYNLGPAITFSMSVNPNSKTIGVGESFNTSAFTVYKNGSDNTQTTLSSGLTWTILSGTCLSKSGNTFTATSSGNAVIRITSSDPDLSDKYVDLTVTVNPPAVTYSMSASPTSKTIAVGESFNTSAFTIYKDGTDNSHTAITSGLTWTIQSGGSYLSKSGNTFTGTAVGNATIHVVSSDGALAGKSVDIPITIQKNVTYSLSVSPATKTVYVGGTFSTNDFTVKKVGSDDSQQNATGLSWSVAQGGSYISLSGTTVTGLAKNGSNSVKLRVTTSDTSVSPNYADVTVTVQDNTYTLAISPSDINVNVGTSTTSAQTYSMTKNGSSFTPESGSIKWYRTSGSAASIAESTGIITAGNTVGDIVIYAVYKPGSTALATSNNMTVHVIDPSSYTITVTPSSATIDVGDKQTFTATVSKDNATINPVSDGGTIEWTNSSSSVASLSGGQATGNAVGSTAISAKYIKGGSVKATSNTASLNVVQRSLSLYLNPTTVNINGTSQATASFTTTTASGSTVENVTSSSNCTLTAYAAATGSTLNPIVQINKSTGVITATSSGTCYIEASYTLNNKVYKSSRVQFTIMPGLNLQWTAQPAWVAQRGTISISNLQSGGSLTGITVEGNEQNYISATLNNGTIYVETRRPVSANTVKISVTATNGQSGAIFVPAIVSPFPRFTNDPTTVYANPDGSKAYYLKNNTKVDLGIGLYTAMQGGDKFTLIDASGAVTGTNLLSSLVSSCIQPTLGFSSGYSYSSNFVKKVTIESNNMMAELFMNSLPSAGSFVDNIPEVFANNLGSIVLSINSSMNRPSASANLVIVNPFSSWAAYEGMRYNDHDYGLIENYVDTPSYDYSSETYETPNCSLSNIGVALRRNGSWVPDNAAIMQAVSIDKSTSKKINWSLNSSALTEHVAGEIDMHIYVYAGSNTNQRYYSSVRMKRGIFVHGAIGAKMTFSPDNSRCTVSAAFSGDEANHAFGVASGTFIGTTHVSGDPYTNGALPKGTTYQEIYGYVGLNGDVYTLVSNGEPLLPNKVVKGEQPCFTFRNVSNFGVFVDDDDPAQAKYYLKGDGPLIDEPGVPKHGMYILHLLEGIARNSGSLTAGWLNY